ncbi:MAG: DnaJ domain-containing protein [Oscillospiraceae bacterium]|jgi:tetratricopeptide (TPR) repeat protein|nr:DnaJ domain-containing protein [Oscillospiraceae bacterium]
MDNPYATLGVPPTANATQIRSAYRTLVKRYHPDMIGDPARRETAQEKLIEINLAYEKVLRAAQSGGGEVIPDAKRVAASLYERGQHDAALRILARADERDAEWFGLHGRILLALKQPAAAHESFRAAIRLDQGNHAYRQGALDAAVAVRKESTTPADRFKDWVKRVLGRNK